MSEPEFDVAVLGAGFGGSLTALLLNRIGLRTVLIERSSHPRFAIGESSTPIADCVLRDLARRYDLPQLMPLASF
ncbi:MAG: FAD-dependent monooxygenase, partial [Planctomycetales bacterium]|nr:FAD-dependent monooxygenase [Planctomycetales bacterium]